MEFPSWFHIAMQRRLDQVEAQIAHQPELHPYLIEENKAFGAMIARMDKALLHEFMEWEEQHHFNLALMNERLYLQGMKDGAQLVFALLVDSVSDTDKESSDSTKSEAVPDKSDAGNEIAERK